MAALQVELACKLADDDFFRPDMAKKMTVQPAKFEMHGAEYVPKKKPSKKKTTKDKQKMAAKVLGWGGFDDTLKPSQVIANGCWCCWDIWQMCCRGFYCL